MNPKGDTEQDLLTLLHAGPGGFRRSFGGAGPIQREIQRAKAGQAALDECDPQQAWHKQPKGIHIVPKCHTSGDDCSNNAIMDSSLLVHGVPPYATRGSPSQCTGTPPSRRRVQSSRTSRPPVLWGRRCRSPSEGSPQEEASEMRIVSKPRGRETRTRRRCASARTPPRETPA